MAAPNVHEQEEVWKQVPGYEGFYSASSLGRIRRDLSITCARAGHVLRSSMRGRYPFVCLSRDGEVRKWSVHRVIALTFMGPCPEGWEVNHINGVRTDARATNLEYVTSSRNQLHAYRTGLQSAAGERNGQAKLSVGSVREIRCAWGGRRGEVAAMARRYGVNAATIRDIVRGRTWASVV